MVRDPFSWCFTTPLFIGSALNPINSSLIATALLPIAHGVGVPIGQTAALVTALYLASAIAQPTAGKAAEVFGPRRVFLAGIVLVALGGVVGGFANDLLTLLIARVLIGLGTSCAYPTAMLLIRRRARDAGLATRRVASSMVCRSPVSRYLVPRVADRRRAGWGAWLAFGVLRQRSGRFDRAGCDAYVGRGRRSCSAADAVA